MACLRSSLSGVLPLSVGVVALVLFAASVVWPQQTSADWQQQIREKVNAHELDAALALVDRRLLQSPADLEVRGWRGRLLAWQGRWAEAEAEYRQVLDRAPNDADILGGLADVLLWQGRPEHALVVVDRARSLAPSQTSILRRRAKILLALGHAGEARQVYRDILARDPNDEEARQGLAGAAREYKHEFRVGGDGSTFNYTDPAGAQSLLVSSRWTPRWSTTFGSNLYQRFGENAAKVNALGSFRFTKSDWLNFGGALGHTNGAIPKREAVVEYGHGLRFSGPWVKGLEAYYQQHWFWYPGTHVLVLSLAQLYYLPRDWTWSITVSGARSGFTGTGIEWLPSGSTRLEFPLLRQLSANLAFANGTEDFAQVDQIGHFSARTFAGGLKYRFVPRQNISGYFAVQDRSQGRTENSFGMSYGYRF